MVLQDLENELSVSANEVKEMIDVQHRNVYLDQVPFIIVDYDSVALVAVI